MKHPIVWIAAMLSIAAGKPAALGQVSTLAGVWTGTLTNSPARPNATPVEVTMEIGTLADKPNACAQLKTTYREKGAVRAVKDYRLCRGHNPQELFIDEGGGTLLDAQWLDGALVSAFRVQESMLLTHLRVRKGEGNRPVLEEEIFSLDARPQVLPADKGVLNMRVTNLQRLVLKRKAGPSSRM